MSHASNSPETFATENLDEVGSLVGGNEQFTTDTYIYYMKSKEKITTLFTDIGGVLLTNGWDRSSRRKAIVKFRLDPDETEERHHLTFDTYESGKISLDEYLSRVVFYEKRSFSRASFRKFMYQQSRPFPEMIELMKRLKTRHRLKVAVISNEGRELAEYRIKEFKLNELADFFIVSSFVHFRKPDADIFKVALDTAQVDPSRVVYLEDRPMFVQVAETLDIRGLIHQEVNSTRKALSRLGLD